MRKRAVNTTRAASAPVVRRSPSGAIHYDWPPLDELLLRYIHLVIEQTQGNKTAASEVLGIERQTINRILARAREASRRVAR